MQDSACQRFKAQGAAAWKRKDWSGAVRHWTDALAAAAADEAASASLLAALYCNLAAAQLKLSNWHASVSESEQALLWQPGWAKALYRRASALHALGFTAQAAAAAQLAAAADPLSDEARRLAAKLQAAAPGVQQAEQPQQEQQQQEHRHQEQREQRRPPDQQRIQAGASACLVPPLLHTVPRPALTAAALPALLAAAPFQYLPSPDGVDENLLIMLHGLGDSAAPFARLATQLALPQTAALALSGPESIPLMPGRSWFAAFDDACELIEGRPGELRRLRGLQATLCALRELLVRLELSFGWHRRRVHLLGHAQGGTVALELAAACVGGARLGSCVAAAPMPLPEKVHPLLERPAGAGEGAVASGVHGNEPTPVLVLRDMPRGPVDSRRLMEFWAGRLSRRPTPGELAAAGAAGVEGGPPGQLLEVRPGEASLELVGPSDSGSL